jgi:hypothetical protein
MTINDVLFALFYTAIIIPVALYYYLLGREAGVRETVHVVHMLEPDALARMYPKLKEIVNARNN